MTSPEIEITALIRDFFFDRRGIRERVDKTKYRALLDAGRFTRRTARQDILRRRKRPAAPGKPPSVHSRDKFATLRNILYFISSDFNSVIIGPRKLNMPGSLSLLPMPHAHEKGAQLTMFEKRRTRGTWAGPWRRVRPKERKRRGYEYRKRRVRYKKRPFMNPALEKEAPNFPNLLNFEA